MRTSLNKYLDANPSPFARRLFWHVLRVGRRRIRRTERHLPLDKAGAVVLWCGSGSGRAEIGRHSCAFECGPRFWLFSLREPRVFTPHAGTPLATQVIRFSGPNLDTWLEALDTARNPEFQLSGKDAAEIYATQHKLAQLVIKRPPHWEWEVHLTLTVLLQKFFLARELITAARKDVPAAITRALNALATDPFRDWRASELARYAGLDYTLFRVMFRRHLGQTIHEYLQRARLHQAEVLLADRRLRIKEIAQRLHFTTDHYFSHFFRQRTGLSPTEYRDHLGDQRRR